MSSQATPSPDTSFPLQQQPNISVQLAHKCTNEQGTTWCDVSKTSWIPNVNVARRLSKLNENWLIYELNHCGGLR